MIKHDNINNMAGKHKCEHDGYEYRRHVFVPRDRTKQCTVSVYEIPPQKTAYPYHWHTKSEEVYYIISGEGVLKTPDGERNVTTGDLLYFPADANGAHKLTNSSDSATLTYIDFDTVNDIDVALYPDSDKIGIWGMGIDKVYKADDDVDYYDGE